MSLVAKTGSGIRWSLGGQAGRQVVQMATTVLLARLLAPDAFGLVSMAMVVVNFGMLFRDLGTGAALIQKEHVDEDLFGSVFWANAFLGGLFSVLLFLGSGTLSAFYAATSLQPVLEALAVSFFVSSLGIAHKSMLERDLRFQSVTTTEFIAVLISSTAAVACAVAGFGVWSLVVQMLVMHAVSSALFWRSYARRPRFILSWSSLRGVSGYSLSLTGANLANFAKRNADYLLVGRYLGAQQLGYYTLAYKAMLFPLENFSSVIGRVLFPAYARIQNDHAKFRSAYLAAAGAMALVTFPLMMGLLVVAEPLVGVVLGAEWAPVSTILQILAPVGMVQSVATTVGSIYRAKGQTGLMLKVGIVTGIIVVIGFAIGLYWGVLGVAVSYLVTTVLIFVPSFVIPFRLIDLPFSAFIASVRWPLINAVVMAAAVLAARLTVLAGSHPVINLIVSIAVGSVVYLVLTWLTNRRQAASVINIFRLRTATE